jgi:hypothetical protein
VLAVPISIYEIVMHSEYYTRPELQRHVIRILWMVPVYATTSWFALRYPRLRVPMDSLRECYEAYVIYSFYQYLMAFLQGAVGNLEQYLATKPPAQHMRVVRWFVQPWNMGSEFLWHTKKGTLNYVILRPACALVAFFAFSMHKLNGPNLNAGGLLDVALSIITNFSQLWSMYCLAMLYLTMHDELAPIRPLSKFVCIKAVVFLTFWQFVLIQLLVVLGVIKSTVPIDDSGGDGGYDIYLSGRPDSRSVDPAASRELASRIQEFIVCIEMFIAALAHTYAFPPRDYMNPDIPSTGMLRNLRDMFNLSDVATDVQAVMEDHVAATTHTVGHYGKRAATRVKGLGKAFTRMPELLSGLMPAASNASDTSDDHNAALLDLSSEACELEERPSTPLFRPPEGDADEINDPVFVQYHMRTNDIRPRPS